MAKAGRPPRQAPTPGTKVGHLTVIEECRKQGKNGSFERALRVQCDCPAKTIKVISFSSFGRTLSCGCARNTSDNSETPEGPTHNKDADSSAAIVVKSSAPAPKKKTADGRTCSSCGVFKAWEEFYKGKDGHASECISCTSLRRKRPARFQIDDGGRQCTAGRCGYAYKPWSEFNKGKGARGRNSWCKSCVAETASERTPEGKKRHEALLRKLGLHQMSFETYSELLETNEGNCWRCKQPEPMVEMDGTRRHLTIDHDRSCCDFDPTPPRPTCGNCVRGLLCTSCVYIIADVHKHGLQSLIDYLRGSRPVTDLISEVYSSESEQVVDKVIEINIENKDDSKSLSAWW